MTLMHIGELAKRAHVSVKTVRYYSDLGLVPEASRTSSGYRRYDVNAVLRLEFVRTLRELGLSLTSIRQVLERDVELAAVAAAHADAISAQIRLLRIQRAALRTLARRHHTPEEVERMTRLAQATADERRRLINDFLDSIFEGVNVTPDFAENMRRGAPDLPDDPTDEQIDAWIELAELVRDEDFRSRLREMGRRSFGTGDTAPEPLPAPTGQDAKATADAVGSRAGAALADGIDPASPAADAIHDELVAIFAGSVNRSPDEAYRRELLDITSAGGDPRPERYWRLIAIINGWPPIASTAPAWSWFSTALTARLGD